MERSGEKGEKMSEKDLSISDMQKMQLELYEVNKEKWNDMEPKAAKSHILFMIEEITDVQNYYIEVLNRLQITPEEFSNAYIEKHNINMNRNYEKDNKAKYNKKTF